MVFMSVSYTVMFLTNAYTKASGPMLRKRMEKDNLPKIQDGKSMEKRKKNQENKCIRAHS